MDIYPDLERVQLDIALTCLEILQTRLALQLDTRYLVDYAAKNFFWHLESIDDRYLEQEDQKKHPEKALLAFSRVRRCEVFAYSGWRR